MTRSIELTRDEAEMLVDICENTCDERLHILAASLRDQWGMGKFDGIPENLAYLGFIKDG